MTGNYADAEIQIDPKYAPIPSNTKAILRQKTLLGETYVELTPGDPSEGMLPRTAPCRPLRSPKSVQLDEIFRTFNPQTRTAFQNWMQDAAVALRGRGVDLNAALGNLAPFAVLGRRSDADPRQPERGRQGAHQAGRDDFHAISERPDQLRGLIQNTDKVFGTIAARDQQTDPDLPGPADLPRRVENDPRASAEVRQRHQPADHATAPVGAPAQRDAAGDGEGRAGSDPLRQRPRRRQQTGPEGPGLPAQGP